MIRDIEKIKRDLEKKQNNDIIYKKDKLFEIFNKDPDIKEVLNQRSKRPLNRFVNENNPTEDEIKKREEILEYNKKVTQPQIIPFLKLNGIQKEVLNFLMYEINDTDVSYRNNVIKEQTLLVMCLIHEDDMDTEYNITRADLLSYLVKDLLCWTNDLGMQLKLVNDFYDIIDSRYYCRTLKFEILAPNNINIQAAGSNRHDRFQI